MMGEEMGDRLQQTLRSLCYKTQWKYAVFWKLKRRARMMLTWEDAYFDNHGPSDLSKNTVANMCSTNSLGNLHGSHYMGDPLGLAVAKMSYLVYSLGEGIIGQVAFTGKHRWIFADAPASISWSSTDHLDGWQTQFSAGIKTVAVVAVVPYGVVQLGSLDLVAEDLKLVSHIKDVFNLLQYSSAAFLPVSKLADLSPQVGNILNRSEVSNNCPHGFDQGVSNARSTPQPHLLPSSGKYSDFCSDVLPRPGFHQSEIFQTSAELPVFLGETFEFRYSEKDVVRPGSRNPRSDIQKKMHLKLFNNQSINFSVGDLVDACKVDHFRLPLVFDHSDKDKSKSDRFVYHHGEGKQLPDPLGMKLRNDAEGRLKFQGYGSCVDIVNPPLKFSAGCELHEALGSSFKEQDIWVDKASAEIEGIVEAPDEVLSSLCGGSESSEQLLEAVVANACPGNGNITGENSLCKSTHSVLTTESVMQTLKHIKHGSSATDQVHSYALLPKEDTYRHLCSTGGSSELVTVRSPNVTLSKTQDSCSELSEMCMGPAKMSRKRARPGENCRPRPRDRQLIQDRIKELRDIVPNGSKCSIDTLLERTIKHMFFLQSVTSHADKLKKCTESKLCDKVSRLLGTCSGEHGASWALEVGIHSSACPIIVENLNMNGQMLVEMLCEECSLFFKIAEVIKGLGFTILKGVTESRAEKTWACFVVEGQGNGSIQRMDILWSLMQLLQPEA